ncbi:MAG: ATP-dependent Clp protease proteolytic subunit [archaeon]
MLEVYQELLGQNLVFLKNPIDDEVATDIIAQLLWLDENRSGETIKLLINSPGGAVNQGLAIYDTIQLLKNPVSTICVGQASSIATIILAAGAEGERYALPNATLMIHQPGQISSGTESDMAISVEQLKKSRRTLELLLTFHTGQPLEKVHKDCERDFYMNALEALDYGIIDSIITQYLLPSKPPEKT